MLSASCVVIFCIGMRLDRRFVVFGKLEWVAFFHPSNHCSSSPLRFVLVQAMLSPWESHKAPSNPERSRKERRRSIQKLTFSPKPPKEKKEPVAPT